MKKAFLLSLLLSAFCSLGAQTLLAEAHDSIRVSDIPEVEVVVGLPHTATGLLSMPTAVIPQQELSSPSLFTPADALQRKPGIVLTRDGVWATSVSVRGLSKERLLILADGERVQTATDIAAALSTIDLNGLERIEVVKGAASVLYGTGAMGGVVNFVTERPGYADSLCVQGRAGAGFSSVNNLWTAHARVGMSDRNWYLGVNGSYRHAQNTRTPAGMLDNSQFEDWSLGVQGGMTYDDSQELRVTYQHYEARNVGLPGGSSFPVAAKVRYLNVQRNQLSGEYIFYSPGDWLKTLRLKAYTQNFSRDVENRVEAKQTTILPSSVNVTSGAKVVADWEMPSPYHRLKTGVEGWLRDAETKRYNRRVLDGQTTLVTREQPVPDARMLDLGLFAQYSWTILPSRLTLDAGLRLDYIRTRNDSAFNPVERYKETDGKREDVDVTRSLLFAAGQSQEFSYAAHIDLSYRPASRHALRLSLSNAYRAASLEERFKYIDQAGTLSVGNPQLRPEQGLFANFSYDLSLDALQLRADVFSNYLFNLIASQLRPSYTTVDGSTVPAWVNTNIDRALFLGAELEAAYHIFPSTLWLTANAGYARARNLAAHTFLPGIPPLHGRAEMNYRQRGLFTATVFTDWAARQGQINPAQEQPTAGYATLNLAVQSERIALRRRAWLQLHAGIDNILNTEYYNHLNTTRGIVRAEPGRNFYAKVQVGW